MGEYCAQNLVIEVQKTYYRRSKIVIVGVTGGAGFIGSWISDALQRKGHTPYVLDHRGRMEHGLLGDVRDATIVMELAAHVDAIIHLAAVLGTAETIDAPHAAAETNIIGTLNVFEAASRYDLPVVFAAVGNANIARGTYCITKSAGERFVDMYREDRGLRVISVRPMNAYGPRQSAPTPYGSAKVRKIVPSFICSALSGNPMTLYGGGTQISDSVFVQDVANAFVKAIECAANNIIPTHPIDIGNPQPITVLQVAEEVAANISDAQVLALPMRAGEPHGGPMETQDKLLRAVDAIMQTNAEFRRMDVRRVVRELGTVVSADPDTARAIGVEPELFRSLTDGIAETVQWYRDHEGITWQCAKE
jgi:UDP-glucose 4-epimerase